MIGQERRGLTLAPSATPASGRPGQPGRHVLFIAWRDLASPRAGGSEVLVDRLAEGMTARGDRVTLLCGGPTAEHGYRVRRNGGTYSQFLRAPAAYWRHLGDADLVVEVCNGMPFLSPLWCRRPLICLVNHMHTELWRLRFPAPIAAAGRFAESRLMPWAHRDNLFLTVSDSTAEALRQVGVGRRPHPPDLQRGGAAGPPDAPVSRADVPGAWAADRLQAHRSAAEALEPGPAGRRRHAGDRRRRTRAVQDRGPGRPDVIVTGRVSEQEKHRLLCAAWLLVHPALIEGWGIVVAEAAIRGTPAVGFDVPGLRDSVVSGQTGLLAGSEGDFASAWASLALNHEAREAMGAAAREHAERLHWSLAVEGFARVADDALARARAT